MRNFSGRWHRFHCRIFPVFRPDRVSVGGLIPGDLQYGKLSFIDEHRRKTSTGSAGSRMRPAPTSRSLPPGHHRPGAFATSDLLRVPLKRTLHGCHPKRR